MSDATNQLELSIQDDDPFHPVPCIICGTVEKHWVDVYICDHCHKSGRAAVEFETLKRLNEVLEGYRRRVIAAP